MIKAFSLHIACLLVAFLPLRSSAVAFPLRNLEPGSKVPQLTPCRLWPAARRLNLGRTFLEKGLFEIAGIEFEKTVELDPQNAGAHAEFGAFYVRNEESDKARAELDRAIELYPDLTSARLILGPCEEWARCTKRWAT